MGDVDTVTETGPPAGLATLPVVEVFGPTFQGEGPTAGRPAAFIRLGGCNLSCVWCDTPYTWDGRRFDLRQQITPRDPAAIARTALGHCPSRVVLTGGEPLLHQHSSGWGVLLEALRGVALEVETNGTLAPTPETVEAVALFNVSPKLDHSGDPEARRLKPDVLAVFAALARQGQAIFKIVASGPGDVTEAARMADYLGVPRESMWISPLGTTPEAITAVTAAIADVVAAHHLCLGTRLHVMAWGDTRGH